MYGASLPSATEHAAGEHVPSAQIYLPLCPQTQSCRSSRPHFLPRAVAQMEGRLQPSLPCRSQAAATATAHRGKGEVLVRLAAHPRASPPTSTGASPPRQVGGTRTANTAGKPSASRPGSTSPNRRLRRRVGARSSAQIDGTAEGLQEAASELLDHPLYSGHRVKGRKGGVVRRRRKDSDGEYDDALGRKKAVARIKTNTNTIAQDEALWQGKGLLQAREDLRQEAMAAVRAVAGKVHDLARSKDVHQMSRRDLEKRLAEVEQKWATEKTMIEEAMKARR